MKLLIEFLRNHPISNPDRGAPLWADGINSLHGSGHGMGAYLNVHEGPIGGGATHDRPLASPDRQRTYLAPLEEGMYVSDEPGCYVDGRFGAQRPQPRARHSLWLAPRARRRVLRRRRLRAGVRLESDLIVE